MGGMGPHVEAARAKRLGRDACPDPTARAGSTFHPSPASHRWAGQSVCEPGSYRYCFQRLIGLLQAESSGAENRESLRRAHVLRHRRDRHALAITQPLRGNRLSDFRFQDTNQVRHDRARPRRCGSAPAPRSVARHTDRLHGAKKSLAACKIRHLIGIEPYARSPMRLAASCSMGRNGLLMPNPPDRGPPAPPVSA
jgi:hypothetical protein